MGGKGKPSVAIVTYGLIMTTEAYLAAEDLADEGIDVLVIDCPFLNRIDGAWFADQLKGVKLLLTVDNHYVEWRLRRSAPVGAGAEPARRFRRVSCALASTRCRPRASRPRCSAITGSILPVSRTAFAKSSRHEGLALKQRLRAQPWMQPIRLANLKRRQRNGLFPDWRAILLQDWPRFEAMRNAARANASAPRVLIATSVGVHAASSIFDSYLAVALTARGAHCDVALCDAVLPGLSRRRLHLVSRISSNSPSAARATTSARRASRRRRSCSATEGLGLPCTAMASC